MNFDVTVLQTIILTHGAFFQICLFALALGLLWCAEAYVSDGPTLRDKWAHTGTNAFLILTALPLQLLFNAVLNVFTSMEQEFHWGMAHFLIGNPGGWMESAAIFLALDFLDYLYHRAMHQIPWLWRFHLVHHTDPIMDVSTTLREHPGETLLRNGFLMIGVLACGASFEMLMLRQTIQTFSNILSHTSLRLPANIARALGWVFVTPDLHHVHHHFQLPFTNTNYGDTLSIWDRLFGTFAHPTETNSIAGLDTHPCRNMNGPALIMLPYLGLLAADAETARP